MVTFISRLGRGMPRLLVVTGTSLFLLADPAVLRADPTLTPAVQDRINKAIDNGVVFLRKTQKPNGTWTPDKGSYAVGYTALPALTLLECGVPTTEPAIQWAAFFVRQNANKLDTTYELALSILLLDRLGDKRDRPMIEMMSLRLMAGQTASGGWAYRCPLLDEANHKSLLAYLKMKKLSPAKVPAYWRNLPIFRDPAELVMIDPKDKRNDPIGGTTDNSNTQFAMLALWVARRHEAPVERSLNLMVRRFNTSQNVDGSWGYDYSNGGGATGKPAMNCVGLLGLAIGHGLASDEAEKKKALAPQLPDQDGLDQDNAPREIKDPKILTGFVALDKFIGEPTGRLENLPKANLYFLWSVERVAVLYNLKMLGKKDWYLWGAEILVANQNADGHWQDGGYHGASNTIDTCLALLFLKRANLAADLTTALPFAPDSLTKDVLGMIVEANRLTLPLKLPSADPERTDDSDKNRAVHREKTSDKPSLDLQMPAAKATETSPLLNALSEEEKSSPVTKVVVRVIAILVFLGLSVAGVVWFFPFLFIRKKKKKDEDEESADGKKRAKKKTRTG
jgi:hypothetical protein